MKRLIFDIVLIISVFTLPWWITFILALLGIFVFNNFYEFIISMSIIYALHAVKGSPQILASPLWFAVIITGIYLGIQFLKQHIILYQLK